MIAAASLAAALLPALGAAQTYTVTAERMNGAEPVFTSEDSQFDYNYNAAWVPRGPGGAGGLLVRAQYNTSAETGDPFSASPSELGFSENLGADDAWAFIGADQVVFQPDGTPAESFGTEDPRVVLDESTGLYYLLYSAVATLPSGDAQSMLSLATSPAPWDASQWTRHGALFPDVAWSKSGALLVRDAAEGPSYLYYGDSSLYDGMQLARTDDLLAYEQVGAPDELWLPMRNDSFDSGLVEAGPMPLPLSSGDYLMLYNSARHGYPSDKPGYDYQYNVGYVVLDGEDPTKIKQRSDAPILSPETPWEREGLTPNVVFVEGWRAGDEPDTFVAYYGAADTAIGMMSVKVSVS